MAQFRTTADILDEILTKAGEPTNGNSPYETQALTYANKVHHAIIAGGTIFNVNVDEAWTWARARNPIVLQLEPPYLGGSVNFTYGDNNITFTTASSVSLEGWNIQAANLSTVYRIVNHTAASTTAQIDASFVDSTGQYGFRAFKTDYEVFPAYLYVHSKNDRLDFQETASSTLSVTLTHGAYAPQLLLNHVVSLMGAAGTAAYGGTYDPVIKSFNVTGSGTFGLLGVSGTNYRRSALPALGFDHLDFTGSQSYTSTYTPNQVARLIEPFKIYTYEGGDPFIYSSDPVRMQQDFPVSLTGMRTPTRFAVLNEYPDGSVWVRFNSYPKAPLKVSIDWIEQPQDLQDNRASVPKLPRSDLDVLIHGAASFIAFDKEDTKQEGFVVIAKAGLDAMQVKNRSQLFRTGEEFAQQVPREDLWRRRQERFNYGYTVSGGTPVSSTAQSTQQMTQVSLSYTQFKTNATVNTVTARTLASNRTLFALIVKHSQQFTGAAVSALSLDVGIAGDPTKFINGFNPLQPVSASAQDSALVLYYPALDTPIQVRMTAVGANLTALTQGSVDLFFEETIVP